MNESDNKVRLQKYLAGCGIASRRACEKLIAEGAVSVDGQTVTEMGCRIDPATQEIRCKGEIVRPQEKRVLMINKPVGVICTAYDPQGRTSVLELLPQDMGRLYNVGRLDVMSEGLLLMTNDGELANLLLHPRYEIHKTYEVRTVEKLSDRDLSRMEGGIRLERETLRVLSIRRLRDQDHPRYEIVLGEGRNRHIRRMLAALDIHVVSLKRVRVGSLQLGNLEPGQWRELSAKEIERLQSSAKID